MRREHVLPLLLSSSLFLIAAPGTAPAMIEEVADPEAGACFALSLFDGAVAVGRGNHVLFETTQGEPLGAIQLDGVVWRLMWDVEEGLVYAFTSRSGHTEVVVIDALDPTDPFIRDTADTTPQRPGDVSQLPAGWVIIHDRFGSQSRFVDVSDPDDLVVDPTLFFDLHATDAVSGVIVGITPTILMKLDLSDRMNPVINGSASLTDGTSVSLSLDARWAYVGDDDEIAVFDVSGMGDPIEKKRIVVPARVEFTGTLFDRLFSASSFDRSIRAYSAPATGELDEIGSATFGGSYEVTSLDVDAETSGWIAASWQTGFGLWDVTTSIEPVLEREIGGNHVAAVYDRGYVHALIDGYGLAIYIGLADDPVIGSIVRYLFAYYNGIERYNAIFGPAPEGIGTYLLISADLDGMIIIDVTDPTSPEEMSRTLTGGVTNDAAVAGGYAYVATSGNVRVYDVTDPTSPAPVGTDSTPFFARRLALHEPSLHVYVMDSFTQDMFVVDVSDPTQPTTVNTLPDHAGVVHVDGDRLYAGTLSGIDVYELSDPVNPKLLASLPVTTVTDIEIDHRMARGDGDAVYAHIARASVGVETWNVTDLGMPVLEGSFPSREWTYDLAVGDGYIYQMDGLAGWSTLEFTPPMTPVLIPHFTGISVPGGVELSWRIASDGPLSGIEILRALDGGPEVEIQPRPFLPASARSFLDETASGGTARYTLVVVEQDGSETRSPTIGVVVPGPVLALHEPHPNPFNPGITLAFELPVDGRARLDVYDARGRHVVTLVDEALERGRRQVHWDGRDRSGDAVGSGVYLVQLVSNGRRVTQKMTLVR